MPVISPGDAYFDRLPDGRYERCILQPTTEDTPERMAAARGGTGEFYRAVSVPELDGLSDEYLDTCVVIFDVDIDPIGRFVFLERIP